MRWLQLALFTMATATSTLAQSPTSPAALASGGMAKRVSNSIAVSRAQQPDETDNIFIMKTAGQDVRRIKVLKQSEGTDGAGVADVKDLDTGQTFTIPSKMLARLKRASEREELLPEPKTVQESDVQTLAQPEPTVQTPPVIVAPVTTLKTRATTAPVRETVRVDDVDPRVVRKTYVVQEPVVEPQPAPAPKTIEQPQVVIPVNAAMPQPVHALSPAGETWRPREGQPTRELEDRWKPARAPFEKQQAQPQRRETPAIELFRPTAPGSTPPQARVMMTGPVPQLTVVRGQMAEDDTMKIRVRPQVSEERDLFEQAGYTRAGRTRTIDEALQAETKDYIYDLETCLRPSYREYAATGLASCRFASRPEVKQILAKAALNDPAASVRAHCIQLLTKLGYHDEAYVSYLKLCESSEYPLVRVAAVHALSTLTPKR